MLINLQSLIGEVFNTHTSTHGSVMTQDSAVDAGDIVFSNSLLSN